MVQTMSSSASEITLADYFKVVFLGSNGVGKTSIIHWILDLPPLEEYSPTIGVRYHNLDTIHKNNQYFVQLCDVSGNEIYSDLLNSILKAANIVILVFDYKIKASQVKVQNLYSMVSENISNEQILIIGNKFENGKKEIPKDLMTWTETYDLTVFPVSVRENVGKSLLLQNIIRIISEITSKQTTETA